MLLVLNCQTNTFALKVNFHKLNNFCGKT